MTPVCVAFKAHMGWLNAVATRAGTPAPEPVHVERLDLFQGQGREVVEPYHVAGGWQGLDRVPAPADPLRVINSGRKKQVAATGKRLRSFREALDGQDFDWKLAVVLIGRGWLGHDLQEVLTDHAHIHVYEGEAVRDATRSALDALGVPWVAQDEKSVLELAGGALGGRNGDAVMKPLRPAGVHHWAKEERLIGLAAWLQDGTG